jgi:hypothetical protein
MNQIKSAIPNRAPKTSKTNPVPAESRDSGELRNGQQRSVPEESVSGDHRNIDKVREIEAKAITFAVPPPAARGVSAQVLQRSFADASSQFVTPLTYRPVDVHVALTFESVQSVEVLANGRYNAVFSYMRVIKTIDAKAATLGYGPQDRFGDVADVAGGYLGRYPNNDIYVGSSGMAFEIHGDIRAKYNALGGPAGLLGMPQTDEEGTPDGVGRFNHFAGGSIYWTPRTGPMSVRGAVRDHWASTGWERGPFGYPVQDQHRMIPIPPTDPIVEWCRFENGLIAGDLHGAKGAPAAVLSYAGLGTLIGARMSDTFKASPDNVAMRPGVDLTGVTDWHYDFWSSRSRAVGFQWRGFRDNGLITPDTDFTIDLGLRFELVWTAGFTEPTFKTLVAVLDFVRVRATGGPGWPYDVVPGVANAIRDAFFPKEWPDPKHQEIPAGALYVATIPTGADIGIPGHPGTEAINILDILVSATGDLQILVNPLTPPKDESGFNLDYGHERQRQAQDALDSL